MNRIFVMIKYWMDNKGDVREAIGWKILLILLLFFLILMFMFHLGIIQKIVMGIKPIIRIEEWG